MTVLSYALPEEHAATGVGFGFMAATWWVALRNDEASAAHYGLSLGGLLDPEPLSVRRLTREAARALGFAVLTALLVFPFFGWASYCGGSPNNRSSPRPRRAGTRMCSGSCS